MAVLGFHLVASLIGFTLFTKFRGKVFDLCNFLYRDLHRYVAPSDSDLKEMLPSSSSVKKRKRKSERGSESNGFLVPKNTDICLISSPVTAKDASSLPWYSSVCWITDYFFFSILMYCCSEIYKYFYPSSQAVNISVIWILLLTAFTLQALASLTSSMFFGDTLEGERNLIISFAALLFFFSMLFLMFAETYFDIGFKEAYETFTKTTTEFFVASELPDASVERSPLLLFITLSLLFAFVGAMLVFPNFRYAKMYINGVKDVGAVKRLVYHTVFLLQYLPLLFFVRPVKDYFLFGPRKRLTFSQLNSIRVWLIVAAMVMRLFVRRSFLQSHLNLALNALADIRTQSGNIKSTDLQRMVFRYYSYLNVATLQYFLPAILPLTFALLLKTLGNYSWIGQDTSVIEAGENKNILVSLSVLLGPSVQCGIWTLFLVVSLLLNAVFVSIGIVYNNYILKS